MVENIPTLQRRVKCPECRGEGEIPLIGTCFLCWGHQELEMSRYRAWKEVSFSELYSMGATRLTGAYRAQGNIEESKLKETYRFYNEIFPWAHQITLSKNHPIDYGDMEKKVLTDTKRFIGPDAFNNMYVGDFQSKNRARRDK